MYHCAGSYHKRRGLDRLYIATPCSANWDEMSGDERVRFCSQCRLHVYNLSEMTRPDAEALLRRTEGRVCTKFYRRADGSILTKDCPYGLRAITRRVAMAYAGVAAFCVRAAAQAGATGSLSGIVRDSTGGVIVNTRVWVSGPDPQTSATDASGKFQFAAMQPGVYAVRIECPGFRSFNQGGVIVKPDKPAFVEATLEVGSMGGPAFAACSRHTRASHIVRRVFGFLAR